MPRSTLQASQDDLFGSPATMPEGFRYQQDLLSPADEQRLVQQFDALPRIAKDKLYRRLFALLKERKRDDVIEILRDTKQDIP